MHLLTIDNLGPIRRCELPIMQYTVLTGYQAAGKSTLAKSVYFFKTLKEVLYQLMIRRWAFSETQQKSAGPFPDSGAEKTLIGSFDSTVRGRFLSTFGSSYHMDPGMRLSYRYAEGVEISIHLSESQSALTPNYVWIECSKKIRDFLREHESWREQEQPGAELRLKQQLSLLFDDPGETVYIPAGRSLLTVLGSQFSYIYATMDDQQKRLLDACTRDYLDLVIKLRPRFSNGLIGLLEGLQLSPAQEKLYQEALTLIENILKGRYAVSDGEERIWIGEQRYVKINYASSGQQESIWILNLLFYFLVMREPVYFIIEEPESNLFPESQKLIVELISLVTGAGHSALLTTHSPYVLGALNNLIYAGAVGALSPKQTEQIISRSKWIDGSAFEARFVENGTAENCLDAELGQIDNSLLDQISHSINEEYDSLFAAENQAGRDSVCR